MFQLRLITALVLSLLSAAAGWAQQNTCQTRTISASIVSLDRSPIPIPSATSFEASYKGKPVQINSVTVDQRPRQILLLLDASGSMFDKSDFALDVANDVLEQITRPNEIGLASFAENIEKAIPPTDDRTKISEEIASLRSAPDAPKKMGHGRTALWDAIRDSAKLINSNYVGDVILLITDGGNNKGKTKAKEVSQLLLRSGIRLFTVVILDPISIRSRTSEELNGPTELEEIVRETGGVAVVAPPPSPFFSREISLLDKSGILIMGPDVGNFRTALVLETGKSEEFLVRLSDSGKMRLRFNYWRGSDPNFDCNKPRKDLRLATSTVFTIE